MSDTDKRRGSHIFLRIHIHGSYCTCVNGFVILEIAARVKSLVTSGALKWLFSRVESHVFGDVASTRESGATRAASVRFDSSVSPFVLI